MTALTTQQVQDLLAQKTPFALCVTARVAASALAISPRTLDRLAKSGKLPRVRLGDNTVRFDLDDIRRLIDESKVRGESPGAEAGKRSREVFADES